MRAFRRWGATMSVFVLTGVLPGAVGASACTAQESTSGELEVEVVRSLEIVGVLLGLVYEHHRESPLAGMLAPHPLRVGAMERLEPYRSHPAVLETAAMLDAGFPWDGFVRIALHYAELPSTRLAYAWNAEDRGTFLSRLPVQGGAKAQERYLEAYVEQVARFYRESGLDAFLEEHAADYAQIVREVRSAVGGLEVVPELEAYFGRAMEGYYAVPSPLFPIGNFGPRIETDDGYRVYYIMAAIQGPDGAFRFAAPEILRSNLAHELAHSFLNPILHESWDRIEPYAEFFDYMKPAMVRQGYATWKSCMADHLARAFEVRYLCRREGPGAARRMLTVQTEQLGFRLLPVLHRQFVRYEASRDRYATFEDFFPEIVATLGRLEAVETRAPVPMGGFIDLDESNRGVVVAVLPGTPAAEAGLRRGDVVLAIGNVQIESRESLRRALAVWDDAEEDAPVPVSVLRDGERETVRLICRHERSYDFVETDSLTGGETTP